MKNGTIDILGATFKRVAGVDSTTIGGFGSHFVSSGPIIQGNRKDPNPWSFTVQDTKFEIGVRRFQTQDYDKIFDNYQMGRLSGDVVTPHAVCDPANYAGQMQDACMEKIYSQIRGGSNLVIDLLESSQTLRMLKAATSVRAMAHEFMEAFGKPRNKRERKFFRTASRRSEYLAKKWLEYRYGWIPFMSSIYEILDTIATKHVRDGIISVRGTTKLEFAKDHITTGSGSYSDPTVRTYSTLETRAKIIARFELDRNLQIHDWTSLSPAVIIYELLPLSFVADWFTNVGETLAAYENYWLHRSKFRGGYATFGSKQGCFRERQGASDSPYSVNRGGTMFPGSGGPRTTSSKNHFKSRTLNRVLLTSLPYPGGFRFRVNLNSSRILDAAALLKTILF